MRLIQDNTGHHRAQHAGQHDAEANTSSVHLVARIILEHHLQKKNKSQPLASINRPLIRFSYRIQEGGDGVEHAHIDAVRKEQQDEVLIGQQISQRVHEADLLGIGGLQYLSRLLGGGGRSGWSVLEDCKRK